METKIICIDDMNKQEQLTKGKEYSIVGNGIGKYLIINNKGEKRPYPKRLFKIVKEI